VNGGFCVFFPDKKFLVVPVVRLSAARLSDQRPLWKPVMFRSRTHKTILMFVAGAGCALASMYAVTGFAADAQAGNIWGAQIKVSRDEVGIERDGQRFPGLVGARLREKDIIRTGEKGSVGIMFTDNSTLSMGPDAEVVLRRYTYDSTTYMGAFDAYIKRGNVSLQTGNIAKQTPEAMRMFTPKAELSGTAKNYVVSVGE